jgi:hypothetical protein
MAELKITKSQRLRNIGYDELFVGNDKTGEVRSSWTSLYESMNRNKFHLQLHLSADRVEAIKSEHVTLAIEAMDKLSTWCNDNCQGLWSSRDDSEEVETTGSLIIINLSVLFELEADLEKFMREYAVLIKLSH